jgi:2,4-dienoyl-CoA reductase-like NADH-dependent reductase (Old Yellow Enzyme family)
VRAFKNLFRPEKIGKLTVANRIAMAPMVSHFAEAGGAGDRRIGTQIRPFPLFSRHSP